MIHSLLLHPSDQPLFSVAFRAAGCTVDLRINDVPVFHDRTGAAIDFTLPINEWVFQGDNEIRLQIQAFDPGSAHAEAGLQFRRLRQPLKHTVPLAILNWKAGTHYHPPVASPEAMPEEQRAMPAVTSPGAPMEFTWIQQPASLSPEGTWVVTVRFPLPAPWPPCPWAGGASLAEQPNLIFSIRQLIQDFWGVLARRDPGMMMRVLASRAQDLEAAYHLGAGEVEEVMLFPRLLQTDDWRMAPLPEEGWSLEVAGRGRMARIVDESTGESALRLVNEADGLEAVIEAWWVYTHRWVLMR